MFSLLIVTGSCANVPFQCTDTQYNYAEKYSYRVHYQNGGYSPEVQCYHDGGFEQMFISDVSVDDTIFIKNPDIPTCTEWTEYGPVKYDNMVNQIYLSSYRETDAYTKCRYKYEATLENKLRGYKYLKFQEITAGYPQYTEIPYGEEINLATYSVYGFNIKFMTEHEDLPSCTNQYFYYEGANDFKDTPHIAVTRTFMKEETKGSTLCQLDPEYLIRVVNKLSSDYKVEYTDDSGSYVPITSNDAKEFTNPSSFSMTFYVTNSQLQSCNRAEVIVTAENEDSPLYSDFSITLEKLESLSICTETKYYVNIKSQVTYADVTISAMMDGLSVTLPFSKTSANPFSVNLAATVSGNENCQNLALLNGKSVVESQTNEIETIIRNLDIPENCRPITSVTYYLIFDNKVTIQNAALSYTFKGVTEILPSGVKRIQIDSETPVTDEVQVTVTVPSICFDSFVGKYSFLTDDQIVHDITNDDVPSECKKQPEPNPTSKTDDEKPDTNPTKDEDQPTTPPQEAKCYCVPSCQQEPDCSPKTFTNITNDMEDQTISNLILLINDNANLDNLKLKVKDSITINVMRGELTGKLTSTNTDTFIMISSTSDASFKGISIDAVNSGALRYYESTGIIDLIPPIIVTSPIISLKVDFGDFERDGDFVPAYVSSAEIQNLELTTSNGIFTLSSPQIEKVTFLHESKILEEGETGSPELYIYKYKLDAKSGSNTDLIVGVVVAVVVVVIVVIKRKKKQDSTSSK